MAGRTHFTGEEVVHLVDLEEENGGMESTFTPGSDKELWVTEDESEDEQEPQRSLECMYLCTNENTENNIYHSGNNEEDDLASNTQGSNTPLVPRFVVFSLVSKYTATNIW